MTNTKISQVNDIVLIPITQPGAYLYRSPHFFELDINRELVLVFTVPSEEAAGLVLYHPDNNPKELFAELDTLRSKLERELQIKPNDIKLKVFGLAKGPSHFLNQVETWAKQNGIKIGARDTGRDVHRSLLVDCGKGRVGVTYSKRIFPSKTEFLSIGTARNRNPLDHVQTEVLILSNAKIKRTLAKQAIEEYPNFSATVPADPQKILALKSPKEFAWSVVLLFDDLTEQEEILPWLISVHKAYSTVQFRWVGPELPHYAKDFPELRLLPPLEPELLPDFKFMLKQAVFESFTGTTSDVLRFPKKRRAR